MNNRVAQRYFQLGHHDTEPNKRKDIARNCEATLDIVLGNRPVQAWNQCKCKAYTAKDEYRIQIQPLNELNTPPDLATLQLFMELFGNPPVEEGQHFCLIRMV